MFALPSADRVCVSATTRVAFAVVSALLLTVFPSLLHAFSYAEHCRVSNAAFAAAIASHLSGPFESREKAARQETLRQLQSAFTKDVRCAGLRKRSRSYGDLVARVDVASSPSDYFVGLSNPRAFQEIAADSIPWATIDRLSASTMQRLSAMHANQDHFGDRALFAFTFWHRSAIEAAAKGRLHNALILNAFADHYLEDLYAPGHVRTARRGLADAASMGLHNQFNRAGARYTVTNFDSLRGYGTIAVRELMTDARCDGARSRECLESLARECRSGEWTGCLQSIADTGLVLYGDHQLSESPTAELFIALVVARSADDVLTAYMNADSRSDHFDGRVNWNRARKLGIRRLGATFSTPFGRYESDTVGIWSDVDRAPTAVFGMQSFVNTSSNRARFALETMALPWLGENISIPSDSAEWIAPGGWSRFGMIGGIDLVTGDGNTTLGPYVDGVWSLTNINSQVRLGGGWRYSTHSALRGTNALHSALRWEVGFGLLSTGVGVELEPIVTRSGIARHALSIGTSVHATVPIRRHKRK